MPRIELRDDGWFEAGKDDEETSPIVHMIYESKQTLKKALEQIDEAPSVEALEQMLSKIPASFEFRGSPYLMDKNIIIRTPGLPGECYLGKVIE